MTEYEITLTINLSDAVDEIDALMKGLNAVLATAGVEGGYKCLGSFYLTLKCDRELSAMEEYRMRLAVAQSFVEVLPQYDIRVESFRCKTGNSRNQSVSQ